jgi:diguanylate cyclase (GGDEF)-like protein
VDSLSTTKSTPQARDAVHAKSPGRPEPRILYVDDDEIAREAFADAATQLGFRVDTVAGGGEALTMASRHRYSVIASDLRMPTLNGLSLIQLLRPKWPNTSYLIVTGASHLDLPTRANGEPLVDEIVSKPWTMSQLAKILKRANDRSEHRHASDSHSPHELPILLVEEEPDRVRGLRELMSESLPDAKCFHASGLSHAIEMLGEHTFRLAIIDLELVDSGGLETISSLRRSVPELPLVVLGVVDDDVVHNQVIKAGAQDYLIKSRVDEYNLRRSVRYALERKRIEDQVRSLSHNDPVTGLPNRKFFLEELARAVGRSRCQDTRFAVLLLDLDRFKIVNDSLGHDVGDRLLKVVAERLRENLRDVDAAARLGGDEFAILLEGVRSEDEAVATAQRLLEALTPPARLRDYEIASTGSIGIALYPDHAETATELLQLADRAMYRAKQKGRDGYALYSDQNEESRSGVLRRLTFESGIRHALERDEYVVFFQPQMTLDRKKLVAVEALVRWNHPKVGLVPPGRFMPFLEGSGLIKGVGDWVLSTSCRQVKRWQDEVLADLRVSVNLSARQFEGSDLVATVERALAESGLPAKSLELEITESLLMRDIGGTRATLQELKALGVRIAIDDFGTGYSSLAYLTTFPLDCLKIDRSFVHDITTNGDDRTVAEAVIGLGHSLGLDVVAEGVETEEQLALLSGCDGFQGFLISRPQPAEIIRELLKRYIS